MSEPGVHSAAEHQLEQCGRQRSINGPSSRDVILSSGHTFDVVTAAGADQPATEIHTEHVKLLVQELRRRFSFVVLDTPAR